MKQKFMEKFPELAQEWDYERNLPLKIESISESSRKTVHWKCAYGHRYEASAYDRAKGAGCPYDSGKILPWKEKNTDEEAT